MWRDDDVAVIHSYVADEVVHHQNGLASADNDVLHFDTMLKRRHYRYSEMCAMNEKQRGNLPGTAVLNECSDAMSEVLCGEDLIANTLSAIDNDVNVFSPRVTLDTSSRVWDST